MRFTLRIKLALVSLLVLFIPLAGFRLSDLIKQDLLTSQEQTLLFSARVVASALSGRTGLFDRELLHSLTPDKDLYLHKLERPIRLNGRNDDWRPVLSEASSFGRKHLLSAVEPYQPQSFHFKHIAGTRGDYLYALFIVTDDRVVYRNRNSLRLDLSDHLTIGFEDNQGKSHQYLLTAKEPGWVNGFLLSEKKPGSMVVKPETRIQGMWLATESGYNIEIRLPKAMVGQKLAFAITDIDNPKSREKKYIIGTAIPDSDEEFGWLVSSSQTLDEILKSFSRPHSRIIIVDSNRRIRASHGELSVDEQLEAEHQQSVLSNISSATHSLFSPLYNLFINSFTKEMTEIPDKLSTLDLDGVDEALQGISTVSRYSPSKEKAEIMAAITPLRNEETVIGAIVVEQTTNSILALQNKVIEESLTLTILVFSFGGLGLILFASRLSSRIRRLGSEASQAISPKNRMQFQLTPQRASDEVGDLSRTLAAMLEQLKIQADFREKMADNLEHEMRTPLAGISASLKNLAGELENPPQHIAGYLDWALEDVDRLESILAAIRDATNLQEMLARDQKEEFDLGAAIAMWLEHSWQPAFSGTRFTYRCPDDAVLFFGDPARIHQMLDKLVENAVSFHDPESPVTITLSHDHNRTVIEITNEGPTISEEMQAQIFNSMVSLRREKDHKPHLGLGLFIVRTIAEQYRGTVSVRCDETNNLTTFIIRLG